MIRLSFLMTKPGSAPKIIEYHIPLPPEVREVQDQGYFVDQISALEKKSL